MPNSTWNDHEKAAKSIIELEKFLAENFQQEENSNYLKTKEFYHKVDSIFELITEIPFPWLAYSQQLNFPPNQELNVAGFEFFKKLMKFLNDNMGNHSGKEKIKWYMKWQIVKTFSPYLIEPFRNESFSFYRKILKGQVNQILLS